MKYREECPHCGRILAAYTVKMNEGLIRAFLEFAEKRIRLERPVLKKELELDHSQYGNFQKLKHYELIAEAAVGGWEMTPLGWRFLRGQARILEPAGHFNGAPIPEMSIIWASHDKPRRLISITDVMPAGWKLKPEYQAEKMGVA